MTKIGAIQASTILSKTQRDKINNKNTNHTLLATIRETNLKKHEKLIQKAAKKGIQILGLQEVFNAPFFPAITDRNWYQFAEPDNSPTIQRLQNLAKKHKIVLISPFYEKDKNHYYNSAAVINANGDFLGKYRKSHIPRGDGFHEKYYFENGNLGLPVFQTKYGKIGVYICYDRHFPSGFSVLKDRGAEIIFVPSATVESTSQYIWEKEAAIRAYDNKMFVVAINRVGKEGIGDLARTKFYGTSVICGPKGHILAKGSKKDEIVFAEVNIKKDIQEAKARYPLDRDKRKPDYIYSIPEKQKLRKFTQS